MNTLLLDVIKWDLVVDLNGNIAMATEPYSLAQDVASACRLFQGELWFDTVQGVPYFPVGGDVAEPPNYSSYVLGARPPQALLQQIYQDQANNVPDVATAQIFLNPIDVNRLLSGAVVTTSAATGAEAIAIVGDIFGNPSIAGVPGASVATTL